MKEVVYLSLSGGLDSTTLLCKLLAEGYYVKPVFFDYGSKHNSFEKKAAEAVLKRLLPAQSLIVIDLKASGIFNDNTSALLAKNNKSIPDAGYHVSGSLDATVVVGRNLIIASILASLAESDARKHDVPTAIALGVHAGDHALYPDCRPGFVKALEAIVGESSSHRVEVLCPFVNEKKSDIVRIGHELGVPFELTRSCYKMQEISCGLCGTCTERRAAFSLNGLIDPISYMSRQ